MTRHVHRPLLGIALMLAAMIIFPFLDVVAKFLGQQGVPVIEIVWARLFFGMLLTAPILVWQNGMAALVPSESALNVCRGTLIVVSTLMFFGALRYQGIAETLAIYFIQPLCVTALAPMFLREHVGLRRWIAVAVGFVGVLIIIRPGIQALNPGMFLAFGAGVTSGIGAAADAQTGRKRRSHGEHILHKPVWCCSRQYCRGFILADAKLAPRANVRFACSNRDAWQFPVRQSHAVCRGLFAGAHWLCRDDYGRHRGLVFLWRLSG